MKYIKFTGNFKDLIPSGWRFWKAFARNYRVYSHEIFKSHIWQHLGGYMEIDEFFHNSYLFVEIIQSGEIDKIEVHKSIGGRKCIIDKEKSTICKYDSNNKEHVISIFDDIEVQQVWHKRFKIYYIDNAEIKFIRNLLANKQIEVREDNGKVYKKR